MEAFTLDWTLIKRVAKKPPRVILHRLGQMAMGRWRRRTAPKAPFRWRPARLVAWSGASGVEALWGGLVGASWPGEGSARLVKDLFPISADHVRNSADRARRGEVSFLGSGPVVLGSAPPWHTDFKTGFTWPPRYCHDIVYADLGKTNDVKVPWELSRFQWALPLAQAYALDGDGAAADAFLALVEDWRASNGYAMSVNWSCTMDVALRAMNWIWGVWLTADAPCWTEARKGEMLSDLYGHGHFIFRNLEVSDVNGNHYLSDAAGLVYLGLFFQDLGEAPKWLAEGRRILETEALLQTYADGVDHEGSVPYHRLVLELLLHPFIFMERRGLAIPPPVKDRVRRMAAFVGDYSGPDGRSPRFGDADDGRVLAFGDQPLEDHRYLCHLAGAWLGDHDLLVRARQPWAEAYWALGPAAHLDRWTVRPERSGALYPEGGIAVLRNERFHLVAEAGPVGLRGRGGHGHNDATSFELWVDGVRFVVDRGAWVYTADAEGRNLFRNTASHSVLQVGFEEMNRFPDALNLWQLKDDAQASFTAFESGPEGGYATARHAGYRRLGVEVERTWRLDASSLAVVEKLYSETSHAAVTSRWWLEADVDVISYEGECVLLAHASGPRCLIRWEDPAWRLVVETSTLSPSYGVRVPTNVLVWTREGGLSAGGWEAAWTVWPC